MIVRPVCGGTGLGVTTISLWAAIAAVWGVIQSVEALITFTPQGSVGTTTVLEIEKYILTGILSVVFGDNAPNLTTLSYFTALPTRGEMYSPIIIAALFTAASMIYWAWYNWSLLCGAPNFGIMACISGVVNNVVPGLSTPHSVLFGFTGNQPRADVVVKSVYWTFVGQNDPAFVLCAPCDNCPASAEPPDPTNGCSPEIPCFYHSAQVCGAALGGAIGATIGAAVGAALGIIAGILLMGVWGCLATGPLLLVCWAYLLIAVIVAIAITAAVALIGAILGSLIGQAASGVGSSAPSSGATILSPGVYVSIMGNLAAAPQADGANSIWFAGWVPNAATHKVDDDSASNSNGTSILGRSSGTPPFCYTDPDAGIAPAVDLCQAP